MSDQNPYTTPDATLSINSADYTPKVFSFSGRLGRLRYLAYSMSLYILMVVAFTLLKFVQTIQNDLMEGLAALLLIVVYIAIFVLFIAFAKRRLNDLNNNGWWFLFFIVPFINIILAIYMTFAPGAAGGNSYGPPPIANTRSVKIFGLIWPILFLVGILAAVAIPAYQDYVTRAQESQQ